MNQVRISRILILFLSLSNVFVGGVALETFGFSTGQAASLVIGQENFTSNIAATTQTGFYYSTSISLDSSGNLWVADMENNRVLRFDAPFSTNQAASLVIGQTDFVTGAPDTSRTGFSGPSGVAFDPSGNLWVTDMWNHRVLRFDAPFSMGQSASIVVGQNNFIQSDPGTSQSALNGPAGLEFDSSGNLWVADSYNCRILRFSAPFSSGQAASLVIGQPDFNSGTCTATQQNLTWPQNVAFDSSGNLWVADSYNNRVLRFNAPFSNGQAASLVIGQSNFSSNAGSTTQSRLWGPFDITFDSSGSLWAADTFNNRVMVFNSPFSTGQAASLVLGQTGYTDYRPATTQTGLNSPESVAFDSSDSFWVADTWNNRVLRYDNAPFAYSLSNSGGITVTQGGSGSNTITATLLTGTSQSVTLSCTGGLPSGASCGFNPGSGYPTFSSTLTISTTGSTPTGSYTVTVNGSPSAVAPTQFTLTVNPQPFRVTFYSDPTSGSITADDVMKSNGATGTYVANQRVHIVANPPTGYSFSSWEPNGVSVDNQNPDTYMTVSNNGWIKAHFTQGGDFGISADPQSLIFTRPASGAISETSRIWITSINGFSSAVTLSVPEVWCMGIGICPFPSGVTYDFYPNPITPPSGGSASSTLTVTVDSTASTSTFTLRVTGTSGSLSHYVDIYVTITAISPGQLVVGLVSPPGPPNGGTVTSPTVTLEAQVTSNESPIQGASVTITVDNAAFCSGISDSNGYYSCSYQLTGHTHYWYANASKSGYNNGQSPTWSFTYSPPPSTTQILITGVDSGSGSVNPNCISPDGCSEIVGAQVTVTATPSSRWQFSGWSTQIGVSCASNPCVFNMPNNQVTLKATFARSAVGDMGSFVMDASASSVWFVLPDYRGPYHTPASKCGGVNSAELSDYSAGGYVLGLLSNPQNQLLDTSPSISLTACGNPTGIGGTIVTLAGPGVNTVVHYYEQVSMTSPVYFLWDGTRNNFVVRATGQKYTVPNGVGNTIARDDLFLVEAFTDDQGRRVFVLYGFSWQGTLAAGQFFAAYVYPQLPQFSNSWYIYRWKDAPSGPSANSFPDPFDEYTPIALSGGSAPTLAASDSGTLAATPYSGFAGIVNDVFEASQGSVYFVLPDYVGPYHSPKVKCGLRNAAALSDYSAGGYVLSATTNFEYEVLDTGDLVSSSSCGQFTGVTPALVTVAGPGVNTAVYYYEQVSMTSPVYFLWDGTRNNFVVRATGQKYTVPNVAGNTIPRDDLFLLESFVDAQGRHVYVVYGFSWQGTLAAATFLNTYIRSHLTEFTNSWYIYEWKDAGSGSSANSFPDSGDQYSLLATG